MRAVGFSENLPITSENALLDIELPEPEPKGRDLLVEIKLAALDEEVRHGSAAGPALRFQPMPYPLDALDL